MNLSEQTQIILISKSKQLQLYHFPCAKPGNALPLLPRQGCSSLQLRGEAGDRFGGGGQELTPLPRHPSWSGTAQGHTGTDPSSPGETGDGLNTQGGLPRLSSAHLSEKRRGFKDPKNLSAELSYPQQGFSFSSCSAQSSPPPAGSGRGGSHFKGEQRTMESYRNRGGKKKQVEETFPKEL